MNIEKYLTRPYTNEDQLSAIYFEYVNNEFPQTRGLLFHVPNEMEKLQGESQQSHIRRIMKGRAMGVVKGITDYVCLSPLFVHELKMDTGMTSPDQIRIHGIQSGVGIPVYVSYGLRDALETVTTILTNLKNV